MDAITIRIIQRLKMEKLKRYTPKEEIEILREFRKGTVLGTIVIIIILALFMFLASFVVHAYELKVYDGLNETEANQTVNRFEIPETIHTIIFYNQPNKHCADYIFGGKIYINMKEECKEDALWFLEHEIAHDIFYQKSGQERYDYCKDKEKNGIFCWHNFTDEYQRVNESIPLLDYGKDIMPLAYEEKPIPLRSQVVIGIQLMVI
ncbi:hypothetical protein LCGC14_2840140, partial [marine sediment metagenome]